MISFESYNLLKSLNEEVMVSKKEFLQTMKSVYDSGDERLINKITTLSFDLMIDDIVEEIFKQKLPKAEGGAKETLARKIKELSIGPDDKVELAKAILDGTAYDIIGLLNSSVQTPAAIASCVNGSVPGAISLLTWFVEWKAKANAGTRGAASTEIFLIAAGKNGKTPTKGDCLVDGVAIESKSDKDEISGEFSISGKQSSYAEPVAKFRAHLGAAFIKHKIEVQDEMKVGLGDEKKSGALSGPQGTALQNSLQAAVDLFVKAKLSDADINKIFVGACQAAFPAAKGVSFKVIKSKKIDAYDFMILWNACAFAEYKHEEGFDAMMMFNRKAGAVVSFKTPGDIIAAHGRIKILTLSYNTGIGQNKSIGGFKYK